MRYVLIDIDGTMTAGGEGGGAGSAALNLAFQELFGIPNGFDTVKKAGKTDPVIVREAFDLHGIPLAPEVAERFKGRYLHHLGAQLQIPARRARVLPGVVNLLDALRTRPSEAVVGLLTGNWMGGARIKLSSVMLDVYFDGTGAFDLGAFGEDAPTRPELVPVAWRRFREKMKREIAPEETVILGDTPFDVECARANRVRALAVATGPFGRDELVAAGAGLVLPDLSDTRKVLGYLLG